MKELISHHRIHKSLQIARHKGHQEVTQPRPEGPNPNSNIFDTNYTVQLI